MPTNYYKCGFKGIPDGDGYLKLTDPNNNTYSMTPCNDKSTVLGDFYKMQRDEEVSAMCYSCAKYVFINHVWSFADGERERMEAKFGPVPDPAEDIALPTIADAAEDFGSLITNIEVIEKLTSEKGDDEVPEPIVEQDETVDIEYVADMVEMLNSILQTSESKVDRRSVVMPPKKKV